MPKTKISEFSATANSNTDINSINIAEGCAPSNINDAIRELMAELKDFQAGTKGDSFNGPVGTTTAAAGAFTTLSSTGNTTLGDASGDTVTINGTTTFANVNPTLSAGTANGVLYLNGSKVATSGSALTFDGTNLGIGGAASMYWSGANKGLAIAGSTNGAEIDLKISGGTSTSYLLQDLSSNLRFGNQGNFPIIFNVSDTEQMRLTSTGLGIGTSSPQYKLHVAQSSSAVVFGQDSTTANIIGTNAAGTASQGLFLKGFPLTFTGNGGGGAEHMRLDSSGNLGLGVTPSAWNSGAKALQYSTTGALWAVGGQSRLGNNHYYDTGGTFRYLTTGAIATDFSQTSSGFFWNIAPSGTAGNAITFTQAMTLDASGNLGLGTSSPAFGSGSGLEIERAGIATLRLENSSAGNNLEIYNDSLANGINFRGYNAAPMVFWTNNTERARIDSSGNFLVGATSGIASERLFVSGSNANYIERVYNSNASPYGIIMSYTGAAPNGTANEFLRCDDTGAARMSVRSNGGIANYQANNVNLSDRQEKTNFAPAGNYLAKICAIPVQTFNYIDQNMEEDGGLTLGVVAQDVQAVAPELVMESNWGTEEEPKMRLSIYQTDLQYALMKCIQEQQAIIESLKARLDAANL